MDLWINSQTIVSVAQTLRTVQYCSNAIKHFYRLRVVMKVLHACTVQDAINICRLNDPWLVQTIQLNMNPADIGRLFLTRSARQCFSGIDICCVVSHLCNFLKDASC